MSDLSDLPQIEPIQRKKKYTITERVRERFAAVGKKQKQKIDDYKEKTKVCDTLAKQFFTQAVISAAATAPEPAPAPVLQSQPLPTIQEEPSRELSREPSRELSREHSYSSSKSDRELNNRFTRTSRRDDWRERYRWR